MKRLKKSEKTGMARVGDVITSPEFANGHKGNREDFIFVGGSLIGNAIDKSRSTARYVVVEASEKSIFENGPSGWLVIAKRLRSDKYDGKGETIAFHQYYIDGDTNYSLIKTVTRIGTMEQIFQ